MTAALLADLHLPAGPSKLRQTFVDFCAGPARQAADVYLLGDLFEYWIGDDVGLEEYRAEANALHALSQRGVRLHVAHGNRDFLIGEAFAQAIGARLLPQGCIVELAGARTLITHGDELCTDDVAYQRWRAFCRFRPGQKAFVALPRALRERIAGQVRKTSLVEKRMKPEDIMDVNEDAVRAAFRKHGVSRIIHGHTHRPGEQRYEIDGKSCERVVLADWRPGRMEYLRATGSGLERVALT